MDDLIERCRVLLAFMSEHEVAEHLRAEYLRGEGYHYNEVFLAVKAAVILNPNP